MFFDCFFGTDKPFVLGMVAHDVICMVKSRNATAVKNNISKITCDMVPSYQKEYVYLYIYIYVYSF